MPTQLLREVFSLTTNLPAVSEQAETGFFVKGFVSVESVDSVRDLAPPENFRVEPFLAASTVLVDHDYVVDPYGNMVSAGKAVDMYPATLVSTDDESVWGVQDIKTGEIRNTLQKSAVPKLSAGTRGLFSVIQITEQSVIDKVQSGELAAFSWKGLVSAQIKKGGDGQPVRVLHDIDLFEVTLAKNPVNKDAVLVIGKSEEADETLVVYAVELSKSIFPTEASATEYLSGHRLSSTLKEDATNFCALQGCGVDLSRLVRIQMIPGVEIIAGPLAKSVVEVQKVPSDFISGFKDVLSRDSNMSRVTIEATDIVVSSKSVKDEASHKESPVSEATTVAKSEDVQTINVEEIVKKAADSVLSQLTPALAEISKSILVLQKSAEAAAVVEETKVEAPVESLEATTEVIEDTQEETIAPSDGLGDDTINVLVESIKMLAQELDGLKKNVESVAGVDQLVANLRKSVPNQAAREETVEKGRKADKNAVFDSHPILGAHFLGF